MKALSILKEQLAAAVAKRTRLNVRIAAFNAEINAHPDTVAAIAADTEAKVKNIMSILKSKASGEGIDTALDAIGSGFDTVPTFVEFPIRLETKYSDAVGQVSAIFYKWKGTPIFAHNIDFYGFWDDRKGHLDVGFTRERFDTRLYSEFREFPKSLASFLPPKKDIQMINCLSRCDYDDLPEELLENVDAFSFLKVIRYVNEIEELSGSLEFSEQIFGCSTDILPDFDIVVSAKEGGDE